MRILIATLAFSPGSTSPFPGINSYSVGLTEVLHRRGVEISVVAPRYGTLSELGEPEGTTVYRLADSKAILGGVGSVGGLNILSFGLNLERWIRSHPRPDLVQTDIPLPHHKRGFGVPPLLYLVHHVYASFSPTDLLTVPFLRRYMAESARRASGVVTSSRATADDLVRSFRVPSSKIRVIYPGVDATYFTPGVGRKTLPLGRQTRLLFVGLLEARKGCLDLVTVLKRARTESVSTLLTVVGEGPLEQRLAGSLQKADLMRYVRFEAGLSSARLLQLYRESDIFVFPSRLEGFGLAVVEAMACGLPVVAYRYSTTEEVVRDGGVLVDYGDPDALASAVLNLAKDRERMTSLGMAARRSVETRYSWEVAADQYLEAYNQLLNQGGGGQ